MLCALSGGVDSAVAALLVHKAVGDRLTCVFVDHGLLRKDEAEQVVETFGEHFRVPLVHVRAEERFLDLLAGQLTLVDRLQLLALVFGQRLGHKFVDGIGQEKHLLSPGLERLQQW